MYAGGLSSAGVLQRVEHIMRGKVIEYEAKTLLRQGIDQGRKEERQLALAETEERAQGYAS